jgi:CheY-like chemotaxis protein
MSTWRRSSPNTTPMQRSSVFGRRRARGADRRGLKSRCAFFGDEMAGLAQIPNVATRSGSRSAATPRPIGASRGKQGSRNRVKIRRPLQPLGQCGATVFRKRSAIVLSSYTVLVVDDDPLVLDVVAKILAAPGCTVLTARDGYQALRALADRDIDLLITDLNMPGLDGVQLGIQAKLMQQHLHIVYVTGFFDMAKRARYGRVLQKPIRLGDLIQTVKNELLAA